MNTFEIKVQRTYETTIKVEAEDIDNAYELMSGGAFEDTINELELEQCNIVDTDYQIQDKPKTWARQCSVTNEGMNEGWCWGDGDFYTKHKSDTLAECLKDREFIINRWNATEINDLEDLIGADRVKELNKKMRERTLLAEDLLSMGYASDYLYYTEWEGDYDAQYIEINGVLTEI